MSVRLPLVASLLLASACTPGGSGSTADSAGSSETGAGTIAGSTSGATTGEVGTSGASTGSDPTAPVTTGATTGATSGSTSEAGTTGDASTGGVTLGEAALAAIDALTDAVEGVSWPSESDYPWTVFALAKAAPVTEGNVKELVGAMIVVDDGEPPLAEQLVVEEPWEDRFIALTTPQPWWTDDEFMRAGQYEAIRAALQQHLVDLKSFRIGPDDGQGALFGAIDMFVIGATADGDLVGIQTVSVET